MVLATTLREVYRACDPDKPLAATDDRYVDLSEVRGMKAIATTLAKRIDFCGDGQFHQQLLTGHRGSGKTTELLRLKQELEKLKFFVVYLDVVELLDMADLNYLDVLLCIAKETERDLREHDIAFNATLLEDLGNWFVERVVEKSEQTELSGSLKTSTQAQGGIPFLAALLAKFTSEIKAGSSRRTTTRQNLERELAVFIVKLNTLLADARHKVQQAGHRDIVLIVDGLEKMHERKIADQKSSHAELFVDHAEQMKAPQCHIIYTVPISLPFSANLTNDFGTTLVIPMVKVATDQGVACLRRVVAKRIAITTVFEGIDFIDELAKFSGGVVRDLMHLIRLTTDTDAEKIGQKEVEYAKTALTREYDRLLLNDEIEQIKWIQANKRITGDAQFARMLNLRLILEYQNGERWADLHPAVLCIPWVKEALEKAAAEKAALEKAAADQAVADKNVDPA